jgi:carbonic anhydrase
VAVPNPTAGVAIAAAEALRRLMDGNRRFREDPRAEGWAFQGPLLADLADGQQPFAAVLGCSDSRVPVEVVFGQGPGQLFVVRVAGNVVAPTQLGSVEFAVRELGVRLVVVLGHSGCGAVTATLAGIDDEPPDYLRALTSRIALAIQPVLDEPADPTVPLGERLERAVRMNVEASRRLLTGESRELDRLVRSGEVWVVGAVYHITTGEVELLDEDALEGSGWVAGTTGAREAGGS